MTLRGFSKKESLAHGNTIINQSLDFRRPIMSNLFETFPGQNFNSLKQSIDGTISVAFSIVKWLSLFALFVPSTANWIWLP